MQKCNFFYKKVRKYLHNSKKGSIFVTESYNPIPEGVRGEVNIYRA